MDREFIYGINPVREAILSGRRKIYTIFVASGNRRIADIVNLAGDRGIKFVSTHRDYLKKLAGEVPHQGVVAEVSSYDYFSIDEIIDLSGGDRVNLILLDGVSDPHNLGAIIRSAFLLGFSGVVTVKHRTSPVTPTVVKTSSGATERLPVARVTNLSRTIEYLKEKRFWIVCASEKADKFLWELDYDFNVGLIMGDEGSGLRKLTLKKCDFLVKIPVRGTSTLNSLNVSVAAAIFMYEIRKRQGEVSLPY